MNEMPGNTFNGLPSDDKVESRARTIFKNACEKTDSYHALRLGLARRKATNAGTARSTLRVWAPLAGAATCCALAVGVVWMHPTAHPVSATNVIVSSTPIALTQSDNDELPIDVGNSQMEIVQNLDFYRWLASQPTLAAASAGGER